MRIDIQICGNCGYQFGPQAYGEDFDMHATICASVKEAGSYKYNLRRLRGRGRCARCNKSVLKNVFGIRHVGLDSDWCDATTIQPLWKVTV